MTKNFRTDGVGSAREARAQMIASFNDHRVDAADAKSATDRKPATSKAARTDMIAGLHEASRIGAHEGDDMRGDAAPARSYREDRA